MGKYIFLDHTADVAVKVVAENLEDLFITSSEAWKNMVFENQSLNILEIKKFKFFADTIEDLLVEYLREINYFCLVKGKIFHSVESLMVDSKGNHFQLSATVNFDHFDESRHQPALEIKAITYHQLTIENVNNQWQTNIVFDI